MSDPDNLYHCENCRSTDPAHESEAITRLLIARPPRNLVINLKRFTEGGRGWKKSNKDVIFPIMLELDKYIIHEVELHDDEFIDQYESAETDSTWEPKYRYQLYALVSHSGSMSSGHYVAYTCYEF